MVEYVEKNKFVKFKRVIEITHRTSDKDDDNIQFQYKFRI